MTKQVVNNTDTTPDTLQGAMTKINENFTELYANTDYHSKLIPITDSTTAIQITKADGTTPVLNVDTTNGYVGIGVASPVGALDMLGGMQQTFYHANTTGDSKVAPNNISIINSNPTDGCMSGIGVSTIDAGGIVRGLVKIVGICTSHTAGAVSGDFALAIRYLNSYYERFRILSNGNIGIGVVDPDEQLEMTGRLHLGQTTAPVTTTDKLYNVSGKLYFNGDNLSNTPQEPTITKTGNWIWTPAFATVPAQGYLLNNVYVAPTGKWITSIGSNEYLIPNGITSISYDDLYGTTGGIAFTNFAALTSISLPEWIISTGSFAPSSLPLLTTLSAPKVKITQGFSPQTLASLTSLSFPELVVNNGTFAPATMASLTTFSFPKLEYTVVSFAPTTMASLTSMDLSKLNRNGGDFAPTSMASLTTINLPEYEYCGGNFKPTTMASLTTVLLPKIIHIGIALLLNSGTAALSTLTIGDTLKKVGGNVTVSSCVLNQASVDGLLERLAYLDGNNGTTLYTGFAITITGTSPTPTFTGATTTPAGSSFVGVDTDCTVTITGHGFSTDDLLTISGITTLTTANGTFKITKVTDDIFTYTKATGTGTGGGTATIKKAGSITEGFYYKQKLIVAGNTVTTN